MQFDSMSAFWHMGGYGFFVWVSFAVTFFAMLSLFIHTKVAFSALQKQALNNERRQQRINLAKMHKQGVSNES